VKLNTKGRYAVMAITDLAKHGSDRPVALADIARRQEISLSYLEQLFARLRRAGLVKSVRGPGGGYRLAKTAADTRVAEVILAVDEPIKATRCPAGGTKGCTSNGGRCITHDLWEELSHQIHIFLSSVSLSDILEHRVLGRSAPLRATGEPPYQQIDTLIEKGLVPETMVA
jgi:Rrf2 family iron-sulfur cluster assembly transcriptional regulator